MKKAKQSYKSRMWAVMKNGATYMILPTIDEAETHLGLWSHNGISEYRWSIKPVTVTFPPETAGERRKRLDRHVQAVVELNQALSH